MKGKILLLLTLLFINYADSQNLLTNGGFESGGSGFGFVTNGAGYTALGTPYSGTTNPGNFAVVTNPNLLNTTDFIYEGDHTTGSGKMLVIDGNTDTTSPRFWRAGNTGNGITTLTIGTTYRFSYWIKSVSNLGSPAEIALQVTGGTTPVLLSGSTTAPAPSQSWRHVVYSFTATATTARIELYNTNTNAAGNDFAVDDFMLTANIIVSPNVTDATCTTAADGSITLTAFGGTPFPGTPPYYNYNITQTAGGSIVQNNTTGVFTNLPPGTYQVTASDNTLPTALAATLNNIVVGPKITVPANGAVCFGSSFQLNAVGSSAGYSWTSSPAGFTSNIANPVVTPAVTTTYTVTSTIGACAPISSSVTVTVNPLPSVTSPSDSRTICPGNNTTFTITGTANSTVTLTQTNPAVGPLTVPVNIGPTGTGTFTTPILNVSATWTVTLIKNFFTLCERNYTVPGPPTTTLAVTVVPNGCATVKTDPATGTPPLDLTLCTTGECRTLQANFSDVPATTSYGVTSIPYCPYPFVDPDPTTAPVYNVVNITSGDDFWSDVIPLPFNFCFYGQNYNQCNAGTNGLLTFIPRTPGSFCDWPDTSVPVANQNQNQSIFGVYQDTDFGIPPSASDRQVNWVLEGQYPCRKLIVNFYNMGQWNATNNPGLQTSQIVLYEVSNIVEVFVQRRVAGNPWAGSGAIGLKGGAGQSIAAPGRDTGNWSVLTGEAWRFTPTGPNVPVTIDWFEGPVSAGNHIGTGPTQVVCPATTTTYTLQATYQVCGVPQTATSPVTLNVKADLTGEPNDLRECTNVFDLTENTPVILGSLSPTDYDITYHTTAGTSGAANGSNPIPNITSYSPGATGTYTVYASIFLNSFNCRVVKAFDLIIDNCVLTPDPVNDVTICDDPSNDGVAQFDFTAQLLEGLGSHNPADYTMTIHLNQTDADNGTPFISPVNNVTGADGQTFVIRITDNSDPTIYGTTSFTVHINPLPTATIAGTTTICSGTSTTITFTGTPNATVNYTVDGNAASVTLNGLGTATVTTPNLSITSVYTLVSVVNPTTTCSRTLTGSATVTVRPLPTATISGTTSVCQGSPSPLITFTGANGVTPYTFTYTDPSGANQTISTTGANTTVTIAVSTTTPGTFAYTLVSVSGGGTPICSQNQTGSATITVNPMPTATISGTTTVCQNAANPSITFTGSNGNTPYIFTYTDPLGATHTETTTGTANTATISVPTANVGTFTYTLVSVSSSSTPACSQPQTGSVTITVLPLPTATISGTTTVCQGTAPSPVITFTGANATAPYTFTYTDALGATQTITTTTGNSVTLPVSTANAGVFTYTLVSVSASGTPACSQSQTGSATVTVSPMPTASISGTTSVCQNDPSPLITFTGSNGNLPYTFTYTDASGTHTVPSVGSTNSATVAVPTTNPGTLTYTLVSVAGAGTPACSQPQSGSATVTVGVAPAINTPTNYVVCDDSLNNDGIYCNFILSSKDSEITTATNVVITYHETLTDAQTGGTPITDVPYCNIRAFDQEIFVRVYTIGSPLCYSTTSFHLIINPIPLPNPVITPYQLCDYNAPGDGIEVFNLSTKTTEIANSQPNVVIRYYDTLLNAQNNTGVGELPNLYPSTTAQIWFNIRNTITGCNTTGSFNLVVNPLPLAVTPPPIFECSNGSSLTATFNLTVNEGVSTGGQTGRLVTYHNLLLDAQNGTPLITTPTTYSGTDGEIIYVRIQDIATGCYSTTTQLLRVTQGPLAVTPTPLEICDPNRDGFGPFDLDSKILEIMGGVPDPNVTVTFHETPDDALLGSNPKSSPYTNITPYLQPIYVRVFYTTTGCANYVTLNLIVHDNPLATTPTPYPLCDTTGAPLTETFDLTTKIPEILGSLSPANYTVTFYTDLTDAQTPRNNITSIAAYTSPSDTLYVRVQDNATGCFDIVELELIVNPLPNSLQPNYPQYSLCDNTQSPASEIGYELFDLPSKVDDILLGQTGMVVTFYPSLTAAQNNLTPITTFPYRNAIQYVQTLGIRITNSQTGCYVISTMDIRVEPLPTLIPPSRPYTLCDQDQDGYTTFDLTTLLSGMLNGITTYTVTFHETYDDADTGGTTIPNPSAYTNIDPFAQTIFVRAEDNNTHCVSIITIQLVVNPSPMAPINLADIVVCDTDSNTQNNSTMVDLTQRTPDVLAQQPGAASDYTVEYFLSQAAAADGRFPIIPDNRFTATGGQTIWVRVEHIATGCYNLGTFQIVINSPLLLITPTPLSLCDDDANPNNQFHSFNLTVKNNEITQNLPYTVTYYPSYALAQAGVAGTEIATPTAYTNISPAVQTLGVVVTTGAGCKSITTLDIRVLPIPTPRTNPPALPAKCDDNNPGDMLEYFDLTTNEGYIRNNDPSLSFSYYYTQADALVPRNPIPAPVTNALVGSNVWIRVENTRVDYLGNHCFVLVEQALTVNPLPAVNPSPAPYRVCDDNADGIADFDMTIPALATSILNTATTGQQPSDFTISYYLTAAGANPATNTGETPLPNTYTNTASPNSQIVYIRVVNNATGCVNPTGTLTLAVEAYATATGPQTFADCDNYNDPYDGVHRIDLTQYEATILNGQNPAVFLVSYYTSLAAAQAGTGALTLAEAQAYETDPDTDTIWVKVENSSNSITPFCYAITTIDITVERYPNPIINTQNGVTTICVDFVSGVVVRPLTLNSGITNPANYTFEWFENGSTTPIPGETGSTYTVNTAEATGATRSYTVHVTSTSALGCDTTSASFNVIQSGQASIPSGTVGYTVTNAFTASQIITVTVDGYGTYEYSLDDGPRQTSNVFENVSLGSHVIDVWDTEGGIAYSCEELIINDVMVIDYPHYFTPNGDGIHDTWNIVGLANQPAAKIYIFDRYGKLLKQISSAGAGWDGTYNGHLLPADDYWFTVDFMEQSVMKQFKAHFTLKR